MPLELQLAIQGGGAKIVALMAVMEAIDTLQEKKVLHVTRIAGTSAGALVGALYAAGPNTIKDARNHLQSLSKKRIKRMFPSPFSALNSHRLFGLILTGHPLWDTKDIELFLAKILHGGDQKFFKIAHLKDPGQRHIVLKIVSANLSSSGKEVHEDSEWLIPSLMNSAGLPFCFRTWSKSGSPVIVDGGICENLPSDELDQPSDIEKFGRVVGITFLPSPVPKIDSALKFATSLLETAMQNSMERARQRLGDSYLFKIDTTLATFDFEEAVECIRTVRGEYELIRKDAFNWFEDFATRERSSVSAGNKVLIGNPWANQGIAMMDKLGEIYKVHHLHRQREYTRCSLVVRARCLARKGDADYGQPDVVTYSGEFKPKAEPIFCQRINVSGTLHDSQINRTKWSWTDLSDKSHVIRSIDLPMRSIGAKPDEDRELLLFLDPPLAPGSGPYLFTFEDLIRNFMKPLSEGKRDDLFFLSSPSDGVIQRMDVVLFIPEETAPIYLTSRHGSPGRPMIQEELRNYESPVGYRSVGWTGENVQSGTDFGVWINYVE
jgi:predicted acylesterase/phospholipase RssA